MNSLMLLSRAYFYLNLKELPMKIPVDFSTLPVITFYCF